MDAIFALLLQVGLAALSLFFLAAGVALALVAFLLLRGETTRKSIDPDPASIRQVRQTMEGRGPSERERLISILEAAVAKLRAGGAPKRIASLVDS
ncbi:MAG: hypothetical protein LN413_03095 [Candidatus Thermoplasmatota archaeon]|nr:hypothetical protein [Candidatus Thermoplasmatota archaeon]